MTTSTAEVLDRGMECLVKNMSLVDAERFVFLLKSENFDYTKWQRQYFGAKTKEDLDREMDAYFAAHPYSGDPTKVI